MDFRQKKDWNASVALANAACGVAVFNHTRLKLNSIFALLRSLPAGCWRSGQAHIFFVLIALTLNFLSGCKINATTKDNPPEADSIRQAKNEAVLQQAVENIEKYRKGAVRIKILDKRGKAVSGAKLNIKQISHAFKYGCYLKIDDLAPEKLPEYERHFARLFNYAVIGTYWDFVENERGNENWTWFEREIALSQKLGAAIQAAPILWGTNRYGTPAWLPKRKNELSATLERRVKSTVAKYRNVVDEWEIVNEPLAPKPDFFAAAVGEEYIESAFSQAREVAPNGHLMINEYGVFGSVPAHNNNRERYYNLLKTLIEKNVPLDVIGIQAHANGEWYEPANVAEQLERYAALGKPIQITEFSSQTLNYDDRKTPLKISGSYRSGVWDSEKQAEFYRQFYTVSFANPQVEAIVTWGLDEERSWLPGIGLIDENGEPKPVFKILDRLINQDWKTTINDVAVEQGVYDFRGFFGNYEVEVISETKSSKQKFYLEKGKSNDWIIHLN